MGDTEKGNIDLIRRHQNASFAPNYQLLPNNNNSHLDVSQLNLSQIQRQNLQNSPSFGSEDIRRVAGFPPSHPQMPPISPYSQFPFNRPSGQQMGLQNFASGPCHSRSLSQPPIFNSDSLPPLAPSAYKDGIVTSPRSSEHLEKNPENGANSILSPCGVGGGSSPVMVNRDGLPPRKLHRRSMSDVPFGYSNGLFQSPPPLPPGGLQRTLSGGECTNNAKPAQLVKKESCWEETKPDGEAMDDLIAAYMNLDSIDVLNSGGANKKIENENRDEMDSGASNSKTKGGDSSDNDAESSISEGGCSGKSGISPVERKESLKRSAMGDIAPTVRHQRSISMDSFMEKLQLSDDPLSSSGALAGQISASETSKALGLEFHNGEFSGAEMKKIMANEKLAEIAMSDPKRAKRILANRQSAARSKERKMRYISELEHKVQTLQNEATTLSAQLTMLQKDSEGLNTLNNELKFRLQAMEQQAQLRDALNDALTKEIQRLRIVAGEVADPRTRGTKPFGFNCQALHPSNGQEPTSSSTKSESNSSHE